MQVSAAEFVAVIAALIGAIAAAAGYAFKIRSDLAIVRMELDDLKKKHMVLLRDKSDLEKKVKEEAERRTEAKPEKLHYPKTYVA